MLNCISNDSLVSSGTVYLIKFSARFKFALQSETSVVVLLGISCSLWPSVLVSDTVILSTPERNVVDPLCLSELSNISLFVAVRIFLDGVDSLGSVAIVPVAESLGSLSSRALNND